jgi:hypothetical protein
MEWSEDFSEYRRGWGLLVTVLLGATVGPFFTIPFLPPPASLSGLTLQPPTMM